MVPVLFSATATDFSTNGIGRLTDTLACIVSEERNGAYILTATVPASTPYASEIKVGNIIAVQVADGSRQAFEISSVSRPINQRITVTAYHISYRASYVIIPPFIATGISDTVTGLNTSALNDNPFTVSSDFTNEASTYNQSAPKSLRACLGGTQGSLLDTFAGGGAGEFLFDNFSINFLMHRGEDRGAYLRYKKNITAFDHVKTIDDFITGVLPLYQSEEGNVVFYGDIQRSGADFPTDRVVILDLSDQFESAPTLAQLNQAGLEYITKTSNNAPNTNIKLSFVDLQDALTVPEPIFLCDTVHVYYSPLDVSFTSKVIKTTWNVLLERYEEIEIGDVKSDIRKTIATAQGDINSLVTQGKKLVSVTQTLNNEVGSVQTTVAGVQELANGVQSDVAQLELNLNGLQSTVRNTYATKSELSSTVSQLSTTIQQTAQDITLTISDVQSTVTDQGEQINTLETYISATQRGLEIGRNTDDVTAVLGNSELGFYNNSDKKLAWLNTDDGLGASAVSIGDPNTQANRWRVVTRQNGSHLTFTRHT